ncbi:MAG: S1 RNA-binding domain-containing protein, partial [Phycisphaerae bacterium]|nr:S1 RNA-binding domain-containing protein [Phycisphaerae bacterium]
SDVLSIEELTEIGRHISFTDRRAEDAESDLRTVFVLQLMKSRLGQTMETVVSGLANFGIFVQCTKFGIEGLIPIDLLGKDKFVYDHLAKCVYGARSGRTFHIGMPLTVKIVSVNIAARQLNVVPVEKAKEKTGRKKKTKNKKNRKR